MKKTIVFLTLILAVALSGAYAAEMKYKGYLSDVLCGSNGKDPTGDDLTKHPEKHTLACMKADACAASGYGMFVKGDKGMYVFHKFDKEGSDMAKKEIVDMSKKKDHIAIMVKGDMQPDGTMKVMSIKPAKW